MPITINFFGDVTIGHQHIVQIDRVLSPAPVMDLDDDGHSELDQPRSPSPPAADLDNIPPVPCLAPAVDLDKKPQVAADLNDKKPRVAADLDKKPRLRSPAPAADLSGINNRLPEPLRLRRGTGTHEDSAFRCKNPDFWRKISCLPDHLRFVFIFGSNLWDSKVTKEILRLIIHHFSPGLFILQNTVKAEYIRKFHEHVLVPYGARSRAGYQV